MVDDSSIVISSDGIGTIGDITDSEVSIDQQDTKNCELSDVPKIKTIEYGIKTTYQFGRFLVLVLITLACMALSFYIIIDSHIKGDIIPIWASSLLSIVIGIWVPPPTWSKKKETIKHE